MSQPIENFEKRKDNKRKAIVYAWVASLQKTFRIFHDEKKMPQPTSSIHPDVLKTAAVRLGEVSEKLMAAYNILTAEPTLSAATMPWTNTHRTAVANLVAVSGMLDGAAKNAVDFHRENRKSPTEIVKEKNRENYRKRRAKELASGVTSKPRGRPKKAGNS